MRMGNHISMCLSSSRANTTAQISDSSTWSPQVGQHISIRTFRELSLARTSSPTSTRTATPWNGESSRSTEEVLGEAARLLTTLQQRH
uniref:C4 protein n=1 Tax=Okra yellow crinkle virus TaxID=401040 RepID=Q06F27_9GEMI|nr:C4 protein [Okra yellow crinkle virus]